MYRYQKSGPGTWEVGCYGPSGQWEQESQWNSAAEAVERAHRLNQNDSPDDFEDASVRGRI